MAEKRGEKSTSWEQLEQQLKELNQQLKMLRRQGKVMIYSAQPLKFAFYNFLAGICHTLGSLIGYLIIGLLVVYFLRGVNWSLLVSRWLEASLGQIRWQRIFPQLPQLPQSQPQLRLPSDLDKIIK